MSRIEGAARADLFSMDPEQIVIPTEGPLFDERSALPVDENLVRNIMFYGQLQPIIVRKNGGMIEVVAGRQRLKAILEINRRARERGEKTMKIQVRLSHGNDADHYGMMISENEIRLADPPLVKAEKARRLLKFGWTVQDIATTFGVQPRAVEEWLSLTDVAPEVREAIQAGEIAAGVGVALANIPREQQAAKLAEMKAENGGQIPVHVARREVRAKGNQARPKGRGPRFELTMKRSNRDARAWFDEINSKPIVEQTREERVIVFVLSWLFGQSEKSELATL